MALGVHMFLPVVLCGGVGSRLWPQSRKEAPKQLQNIIGDQSMLVETIARLERSGTCLPPLIVCGAFYADAIETSLKSAGLEVSGFLVEPVGRDTCAAVVASALYIAQGNGSIAKDQSAIVVPSDHHIGDEASFRTALEQTLLAVSEGYMATISIAPDGPETGFGYIKRTDRKVGSTENYVVEKFVEKPDLETAKLYIASGDYSWNSGLLAFRPSVLLEDARKSQPEIVSDCEVALAKATSKSGVAPRLDFAMDDYKNIKKVSVDVGLLEKSDRISTFSVDMQWSDVGSWSAVYDIYEKDAAGNASGGDVIFVETKNTFARSFADRTIACAGVDDLIIIDTQDALLVTKMDKSQLVKKVFENLEDKNSPLTLRMGPQATPILSQADASSWAKSWFQDLVLPLWTSLGMDASGGSVEKIDPVNKSVPSEPKRVRVQARQAFVFSNALANGMGGAQTEKALEQTLDFLLSKAHIGGGRFAHVLGHDGQILNARNDTYDHAFCLFALAHVCNLTRDAAHFALAEQLKDQILTDFRHPAGGFRESIQSDEAYRRANPHMHLLEAALAWVELHACERMKAMADELVGLYDKHFMVDGLLREYFDETLALPATFSDPVLSYIEPGHIYEWAYLIALYQKLTGGSAKTYASMVALADKFGKSADTGLVLNHIETNGNVPVGTGSRLWPQTEFIRFKLVNGDLAEKAEALDMLALLRKSFFTFNGEENGLWIDELDYAGHVTNGMAPASSLYHIVGCLRPLF